MTPTQKEKLAQHMPFILLIFTFLMYLLCGLSIYSDYYVYLDYIINFCPISCFFAWLVSSNWSYVARRSIVGLIMLNILNFFYINIDIDFYFHLYTLILVYAMTAIFIYDFYANTIRHKNIY